MVIFDLDLTLVDSLSVLEHQRRRQWRTVFAMTRGIQPYAGVPELLSRLHSARIPVAIVTSSPDQYCKKIVKEQGWNIDTIVGFHDTANRKPHPDPIKLALRRLNTSADDAVCVGDRPEDIAAARAAGTFSVGSAWGSQDPEALIASGPNLICRTVRELDAYLNDRFEL